MEHNDCATTSSTSSPSMMMMVVDENGEATANSATSSAPAIGTTATFNNSSSSNNSSNLISKRSPHHQSAKERRMRLEKVGMYRVGRTLGRGNFAHVRLAYHEVANSKVAMKIVDKRSLDAENLAKIEREIEVLQKLHHPYIVKLYEVIRTEKYLYIITEYINNGELFDMLMDRGRQTEDESRRLFQQIVSAVGYCHAKGIVHRDLKAENLLLDRKGNIKLIDFGFSNYQRPDSLLSTWCGSPPYAAPELLLAQEYDGRMSDVWSLGVILYILVTAGFPFPGDSVDKLKRAVLGDHLKIPFWVSVECSDLIRKMLTVSPAKRAPLAVVIQHRWFTGNGAKVPEQIRQLLSDGMSMSQQPQHKLSPTPSNTTAGGGGRSSLDPTVLIFMQQHTAWGEEQILEEVLNRNYESPIFSTFELLRSKLEEFKDADAILQLDSGESRRGSRGSILSGKANIDPSTKPVATTIPTHHLARLSLSTSPDYESDDSSASDIGGMGDESSQQPAQPQQAPVSPPRCQHSGGGAYKSYRRSKLRRRDVPEEGLPPNHDARRNTLAVADHAYRQPPQIVNPLLSAAAQQFATIDTRAWANAAAAAALFASQFSNSMSQQQHHQQLQQAALNLVSLQNYPPPADYARVVPNAQNQERRASANEALIGLNSYAHLLAAYSTMGIYAGGAGAGGPLPDRAASSASNTHYTQPQQHQGGTPQQQTPRRSMEEDADNYLTNRGASKRNTVHAVAGMSFSHQLPSSSGSGGSGAYHHPQRHSQKPYSKQNGSCGGGGSGHAERRSSWASTTMASGCGTGGGSVGGLNISAQQHAQLERLYRQSIAAAAVGGGDGSNSVASGLTGVQQLQLEFQKLCASTTSKDPSPVPSAGVTSVNYNMLPSMADPYQMKAPTISITDENNQSLPQPSLASYESVGFTVFPGGQQPDSSLYDQQQSSQQQGYPRPATVIGFSGGSQSSSTVGTPTESIVSSPIMGTTASKQAGGSVVSGSVTGSHHHQHYQQQQVKCVYVPVSINLAMERLQRVSQAKGLRFEVECPNGEGINDSLKVRVAPDPEGATILEMCLFRMPQSPNISKATFEMVVGEVGTYEQLRQLLLAVFNEVY